MLKSDPLAQESNQSQLQESSIKALGKIKEGELISGEVIEVDKEFVYIDVGLKSDGKIVVEEFKELPSIGERIDVVLVKRQDYQGEVVVSKRKADLKVFWTKLREAEEAHQPVIGTVQKVIKGGFEVSLGLNIRGFCPISKMDIEHIENPENYLHLKTPFLIDRLYSDKKVNIVLTRRLYLEKKAEEDRIIFFEKVSIGDEIEGIVKSFTPFGAFIDLGGFDGLLHINDMSWGHISKPKDCVRKGEKLALKVIRLDPEEKRINLSLKHFDPDPWLTFEEKYHVDQIIKGRVTKIVDFGVFIEISEGIEGLAHISELSWVKRINHPKEILSIGDECEAMILGYDVPQGRISLGIKQILPNPWDDIEEKYPVGTKGSWVIKKVTNTGAFVELEEGIDAFLYAEEISWTKKIRVVSNHLKEGDTIDAVIVSSNPAERRISVSIRYLQENPWLSLQKNSPRGSLVKGEVTGKTDFGIFIKIQDDIEGLIHKNNLNILPNDDPDKKLEEYAIGDKVEAIILEVDSGKRKLSLSIREINILKERDDISKYMDGKDEKESYTLAEMVEEKKTQT